MAFITFIEVLDIAIMSALIGFLFMDIISNRNKTFIERFKFATIALAPAIILHELAHKFVAIAFGLDAVFKAFYHNFLTLSLGMFAIIAKFSNLGFVFLVPGYVEICSSNACAATLQANPLWGAIIAFAGPFLHLVFWLGSSLILRKKEKKLSDNWFMFFVVNRRINKFLFIFNMIPIAPFDGGSVLRNLMLLF
jgi:Zn-dependent protease